MRSDTAAFLLGVTSNNLRQIIFHQFIRRTTWNNGGSPAKIYNYVMATDILYIKGLMKLYGCNWRKFWEIPESRGFSK